MIGLTYAADAAQPGGLMSLAELKTGDKVILASGFTGKITKVGEKFFTVEIARNVEVEVERHAVAAKRTDA